MKKKNPPFKFFSPLHEKYCALLFERIKKHYTSLCSFAIYGSYARGDMRLNSDLDLFIVLDETSSGRLRRTEDFVTFIELPLDDLKDQLVDEGVNMELSPFILSKQEASSFLPLYLDMVDDCVLLVDHNDFLKQRLQSVKEKMKRWGTKKHKLGGHWYWELKPGLRSGEILDYDK